METALLIIFFLLIFLFLGGNIDLIFEGMDSDLAGITIVLDVIVGFGIFYLIVSHFSKKAEAKERAEEARIKREKKGIENNIKNILELYRNYIEHNVSSKRSFELSGCIHYYYEVNNCFQKFLSEIDNINKEINNFGSQLKEILYKDDSSYGQSRLDYLTESQGELGALKTKVSDLRFERSKKRIVLKENDEKTKKLRYAVGLLKKSEKINFISNNSITDLSCSEIPKELSYFHSNTQPLIIRMDDHSFCIFENTILVFSRHGNYITALKPEEVNIKITRQREHVLIDLSDNSYTSDNIASDSNRVDEGRGVVAWLHMRNDGLPDMRYSNNPRYESRTDVMEYGILKISIGKYSLECSFSSGAALIELLEVASAFNGKASKEDNPIPDFLDLLSTTNPNSEITTALNKLYLDKSVEESHYCYIERG